MSSSASGPLRCAVLGAGHIAQSRILPAFAHAGRGVRLVGLISGTPAKRRALSKMYDLEQTWDDDGLGDALASGVFDALYIATPNHLHAEQAEQALTAGRHVLLEKPMTATLAEAERFAALAARSRAKLMIGYRLHCDPFFLAAVQRIRNGEIGEPRLFSSAFCMQLAPGNIRELPEDIGGGPLHDLGIYCINTARTVFGTEPMAVHAMRTSGRDRRFAATAEMVSVQLRFPDDRFAVLSASFGASASAWFEVVGTTGKLAMDTAYDTQGEMHMRLTRKGKVLEKKRSIGDQFAAELKYFAACIRDGKDPEPGAQEGLRDLRVIDAALRAVAAGREIRLPVQPRRRGPGRHTAVAGGRPPAKKRLVLVQDPSPDE